jgi:hypothetical protein
MVMMLLRFPEPKKLVVDCYNKRTGTRYIDKAITEDLYIRMKRSGEWYFHIVKEYDPAIQTTLDIPTEKRNDEPQKSAR